MQNQNKTGVIPVFFYIKKWKSFSIKYHALT